MVMDTVRVSMGLQRKPAMKRKGFVWHKAKSLSRLGEGNLSVSADLSSWRPKSRSSLDLAPALLSIYDSIAANSVVDNQNKTVLDTENEDSLCKVLDTENEDSLCKMASMPSSMEQDRKKRPLSISSMSSSSTSSLSRPTNKRLYLCDQRSSCDSDDKSDSTNNNFGEKLDHLLYIDDDGAANTDEEMAVDINGCSKCSVETIQDDITSQSDLKSSSCSVQPQVPKYISYTHRVVTEIIETERIYINNLQEILEGYLNFIRKSDLNISEESINSLFGNIEDIYDFGRKFLQELETCGDDPVQVAQCFVKNNDGFKIYAEYCTNYPSAVEVLTMIMKDRKLSGVFRHQQGCLNHNLPLGAYLLKPVQRILKYHLLLQNILKNYDKTEAGHEVLIKAFDHMTSMAHHINEMKRKHEHAVRVQEIQSQLEDYDGEDLTRLGELVLEGSFRIYGAKTSRQVFLFEKGVLIGKRKEDGMLSCRVMILCSNLMLVESVPKEPLSFQVIPFDNPRGQHTLQARNLEQKRKWCQEIKRLIIESFKGKIPEKVKGLVMQLGKSQEEDSAKISGLESRKISHHNAPEYLEKRQRMRRKSGTILSDLLKPPRIRRGQRRAESVSPRSSPPSERRVLSQSPSTPNTREFYHGDNSIDITPRTNKIVGRSISFKQAVKRQPLRSVDFGTVDNKENSSEQELTPTTARRNKSFKCATKLNPILSMSCDQLNSCVCSPVPSNQCSVPQISSELSSSNLNGNQLHSNIMQSKSNGVNNSRLLTRFCSMPVLNVMEPSTAYITRNRKCSEETIGQKSKASGQMKVFDTKLYFQRSGNEDLRRGKNSVTAFHDNFLKKSTENLSQKLGPIKLTKPIPFMPSLNATKQPLQKCISIGCKPMNIEDPWERKTNMSMQRHSTRTYSVGDQDIDQMDWLVYANRNSLPVDGFNLGPKLFKYSTSPKSAVETAHAQIKPTDKKGDYPCELSKSDNCLDDLYHTEPNNKDFPNFGALPVVKVNKHSTRLNRSNSTNSQPLSRVDRNLPRHCSTSILETHVVKDHEQIIAEMEDYMKRSESTSTVSSVRFPSEVLSVENKRDSCLSTLSNSSYDSTDTTPSSPPIEYFMGNLKHKINDLKLKLSHRRSGSYDNRDSSDNEVDCDKSKETRSSLLSLLSRKDHTDLQSVLHAGDLGSPSIGQRIAEPDPTYVDVTLSLPRSKTNHLKVNHIEQTKLADGDGTPRLIDNAHLKPSDNLHLQNCDSAFSIQGDITYDNDSPRSQTSHDESRVKRIPSGDSIYERKFSVAFDEGDIFRDSAVYCEMDPQEQILNKGDNAARVPIKSFVKKIEEKSKHIPPPVTRVKQREPGTVIKQRLQSLQTNRSRPSSVERELLFYSRPASLEQEIQFSSQPASQERQARSVSADREMTYSCKSLLRREMSDRPLRSESRYSDEMSTTYSANRLDQLTTDLNNLIVMRGWVKQLIDKFQSKK